MRLHVYDYLMRVSAVLFLWLGLAAPAWAQDDDLLGQLEKQTPAQPTREAVQATFKSTRLINGHTIETPGQGTLVFLISHRFGTLNSGAYNFFGLDQATIRLGLEYALTDRLEIGVGRSSVGKALDGFVKYRALTQTTGPRSLPVSLTLFSSAALTTLRYNDNIDRTLPRRLVYSYQALIARKFNENLSLQVMPTLVHRNLVMESGDANDVYALGIGGRQKITKRTSINLEYYYLMPDNKPTGVRNALAAGLDIETGGHIFQLHVTNSQGMIEQHFVSETRGNFFDGDIYFGFNVNRNFTVRTRKGFRN
jgi:Membrane bound beta barrel domain (DUF5777)